MIRRVSSSEAATRACLTLSCSRRLLRGHEARTHVHAVRAHGERRHQRAAIGHAARGQEGHGQPSAVARGSRMEVRHVVFAGMAAAFEAVDADRVATDQSRLLQRVAHRGARWITLTPASFSAGSQRRRLLPAVSTILTPLSRMARTKAGYVRRVDRGQGRSGSRRRACRSWSGQRAISAVSFSGVPLGQTGDDAQAAGGGYPPRPSPRSQQSACRPGRWGAGCRAFR